jgi:hypothetical protein
VGVLRIHRPTHSYNRRCERHPNGGAPLAIHCMLSSTSLRTFPQARGIIQPFSKLHQVHLPLPPLLLPYPTIVVWWQNDRRRSMIVKSWCNSCYANVQHTIVTPLHNRSPRSRANSSPIVIVCPSDFSGVNRPSAWCYIQL